MTYQLIEFSVDAGIATVAFNRPDRRNAMSDEMRAEFLTALETVACEKAIKALVLTGRGSAFCAGGDISGMKRRLEAPQGEVAFNGWARQQGVHRVQSLLLGLPKPTIAAVNGAAAGLGADTALACDFVIGSERAKFTWSYIKRGLIPDGGGLYFLPRRTGLSKAKELIFSGRMIEADEALSFGIMDRKVAGVDLVSAAQAWAAELSQGSSTALALGKKIINETFEHSAHQIFELGSQAQAICYTSSEHRESVATFLAQSVSKE
ncbi:enoyl-CoA hydratase/isomerase family protein [Bradyrhizobium manausense]|uniref:enoyl-CoA hydratase/isomerase family protein n=1 Tax=Bradyrhizobium manausense TaxID=989370 RepID=UPI001BA5B103|nr:enoyl-CoA hydratase/isomerase family protein [Bradyrhizobium manausense]MBR0724234.1 enoyl-CoA hydratase/isomerase family protein [Bradyrhizobium manausense]